MRECLARREKAQICVQGLEGSGKTVALRHLAAVLDAADVRFFDDSFPDDWDKADAERSGPIVFSARVPAHFLKSFHVCHLAPWSEDDLIEYLLARHRQQCASVIRRLRAADDVQLLRGVPELCCRVLDQMAADAKIGGVRESVDAIVRGRVRSERLIGAIRSRCQGLLVEPDVHWMQVRRWLERCEVEAADIKILRHVAVQVLMAADVLLQNLIVGRDPGSPNAIVPHDLILEAAVRVAAQSDLRARLGKVFATSSERDMPVIASILHRAVAGWRPERPAKFFLRDADLSGVAWRELDLSAAEMSGVQFAEADLRRANLSGARIERACFARARLGGADLAAVSGRGADMSGVELTGVLAHGVDLRDAQVTDVEASGADFRSAHLEGASLADSVFADADFAGADLTGADIARADFSNANFDNARLRGLRLHESLILGATFRGADLELTSLEFMILPDADFTGANLQRSCLTGSVIPEGRLSHVNLRDAELADISWEHVDLREADLRGARFIAGTTRSGVRVGGSPPGWEHPAIYPDDDQSQDFLPPETMRKANLFGADIRGARIDGVDFYLVDLRRAKYDAAQAEYLRSSGAILQSPA